MVPRPDIKGRHKILVVHSRKVPMDDNVNLEVIAKATPGFSGADLANLINEAALLAARGNKTKVDRDDFEAAKDKVLMGAERRSMVITEEEKKVTAYHEAGHALVSLLTPGSDPVHKVSIIPRGRAMGVTMYLPTEEKYSETAKGLHIRIRALLGGRVAEELTFESVTSGASNDLERVTAIARKMVCEWGMSEKIGPMAFGEKEGEVFLGRDMGHMKNYSESTAVDIDNEIRRIVTENYELTRTLIKDHQQQLINLSELILEKETLESGEILDVVFPDGLPEHITPKEEDEKPEVKVQQPEDDFSFEAGADSSEDQQVKEDVPAEVTAEDSGTEVESSEDETPKS
jgi:cell division protease FtsH